MNQARDPDAHRSPAWLKGRGLGPRLKWRVGTDGPLVAIDDARESGDLFLIDEVGLFTRIDRNGKISCLTHLKSSVTSLCWSDDGQYGAALCGEEAILRFDRNLKVIGELNPTEVPLALAISPFGNHLAVSFANGATCFYNERRKRIGQFETLRPLTHLQFCAHEPLLYGAAEHGLVCCFNLDGAEIWQQKSWSNVGGLSTTGIGDQVYLASFNRGIEVYDGNGTSVGAYVFDGTVNRVDASFEPNRLLASTIEGGVYWLDTDGELLWATAVADGVAKLICDPLGEWARVAFRNLGVYHLEWR